MSSPAPWSCGCAARCCLSQIATQQDRYDTLAEDPDLGRRIRSTVTVAERDVLVSLCVRREQLDLGVRTALFARTAEHFRRRLGLAPIGSISDEKFVQNLTSLILTRETLAAQFVPAPSQNRS